MRLLVDLTLEIEVPEKHYECEATLKQWLWNERKVELLQAMRIRETRHPPTEQFVNKRLQLLDTISRVQRQCLQMEKVRL
jgi:hypothetical protein